MKSLDPINLSIEFVKQAVDPGGGGGEVVNPAAQTGDFAIWAILAIMFVGIIAFCGFRLSRFYNRKTAYVASDAKHNKGPALIRNFNYVLILLGIAIVGLVASLSITITNATAQTQKNELGFQPDKIQVLINEETGEATCDPFNFLNNTDKTYLFEKSELSLSEDAKVISTEKDWDLTLNASGLNADLFSGQPGTYKIPFQNIQSMYPGQSSPATLKFNKINNEIAKKLIGKQVFSLKLIPYQNLVEIPTAIDGLEYNGEPQVGVAEAEEYTLENNTATDAGTYTATATLKDGYIWADKTSTPKRIVWLIEKANISVNIEGQNKTYTFEKDTTYEFPNYEEGELAYKATSTSKFFNAENITPKPNEVNPVSRHNAGTENLNLKPELFTYTDKNVAVTTWNVTDGYLQIDRKPIAVPKAEENLIYTADNENPLVGVKQGEGYILENNTGINAGSYTAKASLDSNYIWENGSTEPTSITWIIQKAIIEKIEIMGNSKDYTYDGKPHTFPLYDQGETSYFVKGFEMAEGHPRSAFDESWIEPPNNTEAIHSRTETEINTYGLGLNEINWILNDPNIDSSHCEWDVLKDGALQINAASLVTMNITTDKSSVKIGQSITFTIDLHNNSDNSLSGGYLYDSYNVIKSDITIPANETVTITYTRTVGEDDFIYSAMYDIWTFEIPTKEPAYSIFKIITTQLEYIQTEEPVIADIIFDNNEHFPFDNLKYKNIEIVNGDVSGKNADTYATTVAPKLGYCWPDGTRVNKQIKWYIKPYTVNLEFDVEDHYTIQYGDVWPAQPSDVRIISKQVDLPEKLSVIFPDGLTYLSFYSQGMGAGIELPVIINDASHNDNYKVVKKNTTFKVEQRALTLTWDQGSLNPEYDGNEHWPNYVLDKPYLEEKPTVNLTAVNSYGQPVAHPTEKGTYTITANDIVQDVTGKNYKLVKPEGKSSTCTMTIQQSADAYPKAVLTNKTFREPETLWFFYDDKIYTPDSYIKKVYDITNTSYQLDANAYLPPAWYGDSECNPEEIVITEDFKNCTKIKSGDNLTSLDLWFADMKNVNTIEGLENINWSVIKTINGLFKGFDSPALSSLDLSSCDFSKIISAISMFEGSKFTSIKLPRCEWNGVNTSSMFKNCSELADLNTNNLVLTEIVNASSMFESCSKLTDIFIIDWTLNANVSKNLENMFYGCSSLSYIACSSYEVDWSLGFTGTSKYMFMWCTSLPNYSNIPTTSEYDINHAKVSESSSDQALFKSINGRWIIEEGRLMLFTDIDKLAETAPEDQIVPINAQRFSEVPWHDQYGVISEVSSTDSFNKWTISLKSTSNWFRDFVNEDFTSLDLSGWNTSNVTNMSYMFFLCKNLEDINISSFNTSKVTDMSYMFNTCGSIRGLNLNHFDTRNVTDMNGMFEGCKQLETLDISTFSTSNVIDMSFMFYQCESEKLEIIDVSNFDTSKVKYMNSMFAGCRGLKSLDVSKFDTSNVLDMSSMFQGCDNIEELNVKSFDTSKVHSMSEMFKSCGALKTLDISEFNTSNVEHMNDMFRECSNLSDIDVSNFDTRKVTTTSKMFWQCSMLKKIDVSNFDTGQVTDMSAMFGLCESLTEIDVKNFVTKNVIDMSYMFFGCKCENFTELDLNSFSLKSCHDTTCMFDGCSYLQNIYCDMDVDWSDGFSGDSEYMFNGCTKLPNWEKLSGQVDITHAKVSKGEEEEGFFTYKKYYGVAIYHDDTKTLEFTRIDKLPDPPDPNMVEVPSEPIESLSPFDKFAGSVQNVIATPIFSEWMHNNVKNTRCWFYNFQNMKNIQLNNFDFSKVISAESMFCGCDSLTSIDISTFDNSSLQNTGAMFGQCLTLAHIYCKYNDNWNIARITESKDMFLDSPNLHNYPGPDVSSSDKTYAYMDRTTSEGVSNKGVFENKDAIATLDSDTLKFMTSYETTGNETDFAIVPLNWKDTDYSPFDDFRYETRKIKSTDAFNKWFVNVQSTCSFFNNLFELSDANCIRFWDTSNVTDMSHMFYNCNPLIELHLGSFNTSNVNNFSYMFNEDDYLEHIYCDPGTDWNKPNVVDSRNMFGGDAWSLHNLDKVDKFDVTYARADESATGGPIGLFEAEDPDPGVAEYTKNKTSNDDEETGTLTFKRISQLSSPDADYVYVPTKYGSLGETDSPFAAYKDKVTYVTATPEYKAWAKNVVSLLYWFKDFKNLLNVDIDNFDTSNVIDAAYMFSSCESLEILDLSTFDSHNVHLAESMFKNCYKLRIIDISNFDIANLISTFEMFEGCYDLELILCNDGCDWSKSTKLEDHDDMFYGCGTLPHIHEDIATDKTFAKEDKYFEGGDIGFFTNKKKALVAEYVKDSSSSNPDAETGILEFKTYEELSNPATADWMYVPIWFGFNMDKIVSPFSKYMDKVKSVKFKDSFNDRSSLISSMNNWFANFKNCTSIDFGYCDTHNIHGTVGMFYGCSSLTSLDISFWDVPNLEDGFKMFEGCKLLKWIYCRPGTDWNMEAILYPYSCFDMFAECENLPNWQTIGTVTDKTYAKADHGASDPGFFTEKPDYEDFGIAEYVKTSGEAEPETGRLEFKMYSDLITNSGENWVYVPTDWSSDEHSPYSAFADRVTEISSTDDFKSWMSNVTSTKAWFKDFDNLTQADISNWDTSNIRDMSGMFYDCNWLNCVNISNLDITNLTTTHEMFYYCTSLESILCDDDTDWSKSETLQHSEVMFYECNRLPHYSTTLEPFDKRYAHVDKNGEGGDIGFFIAKGDVLVAEYIKDEEPSFDNAEAGKLVLKTIDELTSPNPDWVYVPNFYIDDISPFAKYIDKTTSIEATQKFKFHSSYIKSMCVWFKNFSMCNDFDATNLNTCEVDIMYGMFYGCSSLIKLDLTPFNTSDVADMSSMFYNCSKLTELNLSSFDVVDLYYTNSMFEGCSSLSKIYCQPWTDWKSQSHVVDEDSSTDMFKNCTSLPNWQELGSTTDITYAKANKPLDKGFFTITKDPADVGVASYNATNQTLTFKMYSNLTEDENNWVLVPVSWYRDYSPFAQFRNNTKSIVFSEDFKNWSTNIISTLFWFDYFNIVETVDCKNFNTSNVIWMGYMFNNCHLLQSVDISSFDVSKLQNCRFMFSECLILSNILVEPGTNWINDAPNLSDSYAMFAECEKLPHWKDLSPIADDVTFAKADEPNSPGFFTAKGELQTTNTDDANDDALTNSKLTEQEKIVEPESEVVIDEPKDPQVPEEPDTPTIETDEKNDGIILIDLFKFFAFLNNILFIN